MSRRTSALYSICAGILALLTGFLSLPAGAQDYPARRIAIVVPYPAGSGFDTVVRTVGQNLPR